MYYPYMVHGLPCRVGPPYMLIIAKLIFRDFPIYSITKPKILITATPNKLCMRKCG